MTSPKMDARLSTQPEVAARFRNAFPASLADDFAAALDAIPPAQHPPTTHDIGPICLAGENLRIPYRFYSEKPTDGVIAHMRPQQGAVLACIYTRHHNGYVREEFADRLITTNRPWVVPYLLQLVGEYVCEIIQLLADHLSDLNGDLVAGFAADNSPFVALTQRRVLSYWDAYYRSRFPRFTDYPGFQIMDAFHLWRRDLTPRLLIR